MQNFPESLAKKLQARKDASAFRILPAYSSLVDFSSNDYLGFSRNNTIAANAVSVLAQYPYNGATGSRLISGNHPLYSDAEQLIAKYHDSETALIFNSGYDANIGFFSSVPQKNDIVLYDEFIHASIRDGMRLGNARAYKFKHNSVESLKSLLQKFRESAVEIYIVTESVFSMDGDSPNLAEMAGLCSELKCRLVVDEAHAVGVFGSGLATNSDCFARIVTFGKALGCHGAAVFGSVALKDYLVNFARSFIYTTALPPHSVATIIASYDYLQREADTNRSSLFSNISNFKKLLKESDLGKYFISSESAIHCAVIPGNERVRNLAANLQEQGFDVRAILAPTVPSGQERLRFCLHSYNTHSEIEAVIKQLMLHLQ
ncbi:8-amino-7-oxononanoate synthase [Flavobacterium sp. J372]|uniref:aminotransferase class I/II-fold pyridoxal phosphate-dependent enzyme n=1 Tax=Flavobacterium sp. J372 TaxID=2898436 RepID=UPI002150AFB0|nr:8-amino-7-oxononanoate synthase [Flavobacterium sp. J372]MCR5861283.1 8-amino-7-oxononanoate synthase [Flavobacterium sp. J372]MCR5863673.1 8-amino-7-oxononanoate synthase [Flavobacterium sp. J372]